MGSRSSIFSSDTLVERIRPGKAALAVLAFCAAARIVVFLCGPGFSLFLGGWGVDKYYGHAYQCAEDRRASPPVYLLSGTSRVALGTVLSVFAREMGVDEDCVAKLTFPAGSAWELLRLLDAQPHLLQNLRLLVVDVSFCMFNEHFRDPFGKHRFDRLSLLEDRWAMYHGVEKATALFDWLWPAGSERRSLWDWLQSARSRWNRGRDYIPQTIAWEIHEEGGTLPNLEKFSALNTVKRHMGDFTYSTFMERVYRELAALCRERGIRLMIALPPLNEGYLETVHREPRMEEGYQRVMAFLRSLDALPHVQLDICESPADLGFPADEDFFLDYGHLTRKGAEVYTRHLVRRILEEEAPRLAKKP